MVDFAGYFLPIQYTEGIPESHRHTRSHASLFDVSHMLQTFIRGKDRIRLIEAISTADVQGMKYGRGCLSLFTDNITGGILDDLIITKSENYLFVVSNASRRGSDIQLMLEAQEKIVQSGGEVELEFRDDLSLIALQGPKAASALSHLTHTDLSELYFMSSTEADVCGLPCRISRAGYTGEDGFELSVNSDHVKTIAEALVENPDVRPAGLGARDSLRLEAGLCLYGNDIDITTTPASAALMWTIGKRRKENRDFPGAEIILADKPKEKRFGLISTKAGPPVRGRAVLQNSKGETVGRVTSGCPSPTLGTTVAMAYLPSDTKIGSIFTASVRGKVVEMQVVRMPFVKPKYYIKTNG